ncbi:hypothetical protein LCGC14_1105630 [marine sediment metagenome]|uniref:Uncharacterized protein n=1 Tax=marine sediment metagenome TaxID=412755 RepID=A0A0F9M862_9ZZZZ
MVKWEYCFQPRIENIKDAERIFASVGLSGWTYCGIIILGRASMLAFKRELETDDNTS